MNRPTEPIERIPVPEAHEVPFFDFVEDAGGTATSQMMDVG